MSKRTLAAAVIGLGLLSIVYANATPANAQGYGPGMMGWGGYGPGMMGGPGYGPGRGFGPGMMGFGPGMMGFGPGMMGGCLGFGSDGQVSTFVDGRIAFLRAELKITDAQKAVWDGYADAIKRNFQSMRGMWETMKTVFEAKTPVERLDAHIASMESRVQALKDLKPALANLYAALSDDQKKKADEFITGMGCMM